MRVTVIIPEMLQAGMEILSECRQRESTDAETCILIWEAMEAIRTIAELRRQGTVH